jgi:hypothetical protein
LTKPYAGESPYAIEVIERISITPYDLYGKMCAITRREIKLIAEKHTEGGSTTSQRGMFVVRHATEWSAVFGGRHHSAFAT